MSNEYGKQRNFRDADDDAWERFGQEAERRGEDRSTALRRFIREYAAGGHHPRA